MNEQEILDNAPEGATHVGPYNYRRGGFIFPFKNGLSNSHQEGFRSLSDIKRIAQLEKMIELGLGFDDLERDI